MTKYGIQTSRICRAGLASPGMLRVSNLSHTDLHGSQSFCFPDEHGFDFQSWWLLPVQGARCSAWFLCPRPGTWPSMEGSVL